MPKLIPAILSRDQSDVRSKLAFLDQYPSLEDVQIDFTDGRFVENTTVSPTEIQGLSTRLAIEAHLMVVDPQNYFFSLVKLPASSVVIHYEAIHDFEKLRILLSNAKHLGFGRAVAVNPDTDTAIFDHLVEVLDFAVILGVRPGFQGKKFLPETFLKIPALKKRHPKLGIEVDGGINLNNIGRVIACGADRIVVGSGIWQTVDKDQTIKNLITIIEKK